MTDIDGLKQRISLVDLRLQTAQSSRERESASLIEMWEEMRQRHAVQQETVAELRNTVADLETKRDELTGLVMGLLEAVENGIERMADDTIPDIREMAAALMEPDQNTSPEDLAEGGNGFELALDAAEEEGSDFETSENQPLRNQGIKDLIERVELSARQENDGADAYNEPWTDEDDRTDQEENDELFELRAELERLRQQSLAATA